MKKYFIIIFLAVSFSVACYSQTYNYDVNGDGNVTSADITAIYNYLLGNVPTEPPTHTNDDYVDLELPSGTLWATMNVGASNPEDYGFYFAWGETTPKEYYNWSTYTWCCGTNNTLTKYCTKSDYGYNGFVDNRTELDPENDAATVNWGEMWRMPSKEQFDELLTECSWQWTTMNSVNGFLVTSNHNGDSLFLPAAGVRIYGSSSLAGSNCKYWSVSLDDSCPIEANFLSCWSSGSLFLIGEERFYGLSVRAVRVP